MSGRISHARVVGWAFPSSVQFPCNRHHPLGSGTESEPDPDSTFSRTLARAQRESHRKGRVFKVPVNKSVH